MNAQERIEWKRKQVEEAAREFGVFIARQTFEEGVGLDVDLATIENLAALASKQVVRGIVEQAVAEQAKELGEEHPCPGCGRSCRLKQKPRPIQVRGGEADLVEPVAHCSACRRDFFPSASGAEG